VEACLNLPKERYAMTSNSTVVPLGQPDSIDDPLTAVLRSGARRLLAQAIEAEAETVLAEMKGHHLGDGRERVVRHGHGPERLVQTGIGPVAVERVKLRERGADEAGAERIRFTSALLPRWARRARSPVTSRLVTLDAHPTTKTSRGAADPLPARRVHG
jgi:putative transposase